jgi:hypothetical protein
VRLETVWLLLHWLAWLWLIALLTAFSSFVQNTIEKATDTAILKTPLEKAIAKHEKDGGA